jgi:hypothetical protein
MSRYPVLGRPAGGYDESLLQFAPQITRADRQQGYNVDILEQGAGYQYGANVPRRQPIAQGYEPRRFQQRQPPQQPSYPYDQSIPPSFEKAEYYSSSSNEDQRDIFAINPFKPKKPWFRTKRGLLILFVVILVVAGATVGITFGVRAAMNKAAADKKAAQRSGQGGSDGESSGVGKGGAVTNDSNAIPTLPSLSLVTLGNTQQPAASVAPQQNLTLKLSPAPATTAPQARPAVPQATGVNLVGVVPTPTQVASVTPANVGPTPSVDPVCARFPSLPSCKQG